MDLLDPSLLAAYNEVRTTPNKAIFCHAPFTSMNFAQDGDVTVCCYNRKYLLGTYPHDSLDEMWYGERAETLRHMMARNELPMGCDLCLSQFWSRNFGGLKARFYDQLAEERYAQERGRFTAPPKVMEFEISNVCNLECTMCNGFFSSAIRQNREHLPPLKSPYDDAFIRQLESFMPHLTEARFLGGEPFLIRPYYQIWDMIVRLNPAIEVSITTNATILNDRIKAVLERMRCHIIVSIDALERDNYERIRVNADYDEVMANVDYFVDYSARKDTRMTLAVCPMRQNWRELPQIVRFCNDRGLLVFFNTVIFPGDATFRNMCHAELDEIVTTLTATAPDSGPGVWTHNRNQYCGLINQIAVYRAAKAAYLDVPPTLIGADRWSLKLFKDSRARLEADAGAHDVMRVAIDGLSGREEWVVRLETDRVPLKSTNRYLVGFRARSDAPRRAGFGAHGEPPRCPALGLYVNVGLSPVWTRFEVAFVPNRSDDEARLFLNVGDSRVPVELADVTIRALPAGDDADPPDPTAGEAVIPATHPPKGPVSFTK